MRISERRLHPNTMAPIMIISIKIALLSMMMADGCPVVTSVNGSCCETKGNTFKFSYSLVKSRVYNITNFCGDCELVAEGYCDTTSSGGGWLVIQRRQDGSVDFDRDWEDYEDGFGSLTGEFWYGLRAIHCLTSQGRWELRIDYTLADGTKGHISYSNFRILSVAEFYKLTISGFSGAISDPFTTLNGRKFTTKDNDNDKWSSNCATDYAGKAGGWWYNACSLIMLNHQYRSQYTLYISGKYQPLKFVEMKIRPINCN